MSNEKDKKDRDKESEKKRKHSPQEYVRPDPSAWNKIKKDHGTTHDSGGGSDDDDSDGDTGPRLEK